MQSVESCDVSVDSSMQQISATALAILINNKNNNNNNHLAIRSSYPHVALSP